MLLERVLLSKTMHAFIITLVLVNGILLGLKTVPDRLEGYHSLIHSLDFIIVAILVAEVMARVLVMKKRFFSRGWNVFDLIVVSASAIGFFIAMPVVQSLRVLLLFRIIEFSAPMRLLTRSLIMAFPGIINSIIILGIVFYAFALIGVYSYGQSSPLYFGHINAAILSLFQLMVFDNFGRITWSLVHDSPQSWFFVLAFLFFTAFSFINLLIGVVVNAINAASSEALKLEEHKHRVHIHDEIKVMKNHIIKILKHHKITW